VSEAEGSVRCQDCLLLLPFAGGDVAMLEGHLQSDHVASYEAYESTCSGQFSFLG
jgi:hypothetical protein